MFIVEKADDLKQLVGELDRFRQQYGQESENQIDPRLIGILYQIYTPAFVRGAVHPLIAATQTKIFLADGSLRTMFPLSGEALRQLFRRL